MYPIITTNQETTIDIQKIKRKEYKQNIKKYITHKEREEEKKDQRRMTEKGEHLTKWQYIQIYQ